MVYWNGLERYWTASLSRRSLGIETERLGAWTERHTPNRSVQQKQQHKEERMAKKY